MTLFELRMSCNLSWFYSHQSCESSIAKLTVWLLSSLYLNLKPSGSMFFSLIFFTISLLPFCQQKCFCFHDLDSIGKDCPWKGKGWGCLIIFLQSNSGWSCAKTASLCCPENHMLHRLLPSGILFKNILSQDLKPSYSQGWLWMTHIIWLELGYEWRYRSNHMFSWSHPVTLYSRTKKKKASF